jgi:hypothetical protein
MDVLQASDSSLELVLPGAAITGHLEESVARLWLPPESVAI